MTFGLRHDSGLRLDGFPGGVWSTQISSEVSLPRMERREKVSPLPSGWVHDFMHEADLEKSFRALEGCPHFHADTMRGRIRTLQLRTAEAWRYYDSAEVSSRRAEESIPNLRRTFVLQVYRFDNALLEASESKEAEIGDPTFPTLPSFSSALLKEFPELSGALRMRARVQGSYLLHSARWTEALEVFTRLTEDRGLRHGGLAQPYLSIACCHYNLGNESEMQRFLHSAELAVHACGQLLTRAHLCGLLYAVHLVREDPEQANDWKEFLYSLPCPLATRDTFFAWGEKFVAVCHENNHLVVF